jgi:hypothetical protein
MNLHQVRDVVGRLTYKPGWRFEVDPGMRFGSVYNGEMVVAELRVSQRSKDATLRTPGDSWTMMVEPLREFQCQDERTLLEAVYRLVKRLELHELDEWFKVDGLTLHNPHPEVEWHREHTWKGQLETVQQAGDPQDAGYLRQGAGR